MVEAGLWGLLASSSLLLAAIVAFALPISQRVLGLVMAFGGGVLISAVAYELVEEAFTTARGAEYVAAGLAAGSVAFHTGNVWIDAHDRKRSHARDLDNPRAIVLGIVLDGLPESIVIGIGLAAGEGVSAAVVVAVFLSNAPESVAATVGLARSGFRRLSLVALWAAVIVASAVAAAVGYGAFSSASDPVVALMLSFAGGAILTMLADTMMPEAFEHGGRATGLFTTFGFSVAFVVTSMS